VLLSAVPSPAQIQQDAGYSETTTVVRYVIEVRVVDSRGEPVRGLSAEDFTVMLGSDAAEVEEAAWIGSSIGNGKLGAPSAVSDEEPRPGRNFVLLVQTDFARNAQRMYGQLKFNMLFEQVIEGLGPRDRMAVLSHDSHLKLRLDFSQDRDAIRKAIRESIRTSKKALSSDVSGGPSLAPYLDRAEMHRSSTGESSMLVIARALTKIEGNRTMLVAGWGMGDRTGRAVTLKSELLESIRLLQQERVSTIVVNTGIGGQLSLGLSSIARATGGLYLHPSDFPQQTADRLMGSLAGVWELVVRTRRPLEPGEYRLSVNVAKKGAHVFAPPSVIHNASNFPENAEIFQSEQRNAASADSPREEAIQLFQRAKSLMQSGSVEGVEELLSRVILATPDFPEAWYERAMLSATRGAHAEAKADLRKYLELAPRGAHAADARTFLKSLP